MAPPPDLVFATSERVAFRIPINQVDGRARRALASVLRPSTQVSPVAKAIPGLEGPTERLGPSTPIRRIQVREAVFVTTRTHLIGAGPGQSGETDRHSIITTP